MDTMASQITSLTIVYLTVYSCRDQRTHQSSALLAFVPGIHRWSVNSPHKWPVARKMFSFDDVIMKRTARTRRGMLCTKVLSLTDPKATQACCRATCNCAAVVGGLSMWRIIHVMDLNRHLIPDVSYRVQIWTFGWQTHDFHLLLARVVWGGEISWTRTKLFWKVALAKGLWFGTLCHHSEIQAIRWQMDRHADTNKPFTLSHPRLSIYVMQLETWLVSEDTVADVRNRMTSCPLAAAPTMR